jgi:hypothetical protein
MDAAAILLVVSADDLIPDIDVFAAAVRAAACSVPGEGAIVFTRMKLTTLTEWNFSASLGFVEMEEASFGRAEEALWSESRYWIFDIPARWPLEVRDSLVVLPQSGSR